MAVWNLLHQIQTRSMRWIGIVYRYTGVLFTYKKFIKYLPSYCYPIISINWILSSILPYSTLHYKTIGITPYHHSFNASIISVCCLWMIYTDLKKSNRKTYSLSCRIICPFSYFQTGIAPTYLDSLKKNIIFSYGKIRIWSFISITHTKYENSRPERVFLYT